MESNIRTRNSKDDLRTGKERNDMDDDDCMWQSKFREFAEYSIFCVHV